MAYVDSHSVRVDATPDQVWHTVLHLGGDERLWVPRELWRARGRVERLVGGPGHRIQGPGRALEVGDEMDFWKVLEVHPPTRLRLRALSLLPGTALLDIEVAADGATSLLTLRTTFEPAGLPGHLFWWAELPAHRVVFGMVTRRLGSLVTSG